MPGPDGASVLGMAVVELVTSSCSHALPNREGTTTLVRLGPAAAMLTLQDDGVGFEVEEGTRHGLGLVGRLVKRIGGTLGTNLNDGTVWKLSFPGPEQPRGQG